MFSLKAVDKSSENTIKGFLDPKAFYWGKTELELEIMPNRPCVLILCAEQKKSAQTAEKLATENIDAIAASDIQDAILRLQSRRFDMAIIESDCGSGPKSGVSFLANARKRLPMMQRVLLETTPIEISPHALVNEVAPSAILPGEVNPQEVKKLLNMGPNNPLHATVASLDKPLDAEEADNSTPGMEISELRRLNFITQVSSSLNSMVEDPNIILPVLPEIADQVRKVMGNELNDFDAVAELVETEQGMSARILQVANSPIYAGLERIKSIQQAIGRLGIRETRNILMAVIAQHLFKTNIHNLHEMMKRLWLHSIATAYSNEMIVQEMGIKDSEDFFMMGLLHDIGKLLIIHLIQAGVDRSMWREADATEDTINQVLKIRHNDMGARLLEKWQYPANFRDVVRLHDDHANIQVRSEAVLVTYFSNLLTRKSGFSLIPYQGDPLADQELATALNMSPQKRTQFEKTIKEITSKIMRSCFAE